MKDRMEKSGRVDSDTSYTEVIADILIEYDCYTMKQLWTDVRIDMLDFLWQYARYRQARDFSFAISANLVGAIKGLL